MLTLTRRTGEDDGLPRLDRPDIAIVDVIMHAPERVEVRRRNPT